MKSSILKRIEEIEKKLSLNDDNRVFIFREDNEKTRAEKKEIEKKFPNALIIQIVRVPRPA